MKKSLHERIADHVHATAKAQEWARKGMELANEGKWKQAEAAHRKAKYWLERALKIEVVK